MVYRHWSIQAYPTSLGYLARYTSPIGLTRDVGGLFPSDRLAIAYAQAVVDHLIRCERLGLGPVTEATREAALDASPVGPADLN